MAKIIGIDLGTANSLVCVKNKGIVLRTPSVVAISKSDRQVVALGDKARRMLGKTPEGIEAIKPLRDGVVANPDVTSKMIRAFFEYTEAISFFSRPSVIICIPYNVTEVEKRAVEDAAFEAGARAVALIEEPLAAAIGTGIKVGGLYFFFIFSAISSSSFLTSFGSMTSALSPKVNIQEIRLSMSEYSAVNSSLPSSVSS